MKKALLSCFILVICFCLVSCGKEIKELDVKSTKYESVAPGNRYYHGELTEDNGLFVSCEHNVTFIEKDQFSQPIPDEKAEWKLMYVGAFLKNTGEKNITAKVDLTLKIEDEVVELPNEEIKELGYQYASEDTELPTKFVLEADDSETINETLLIDYEKYKDKQGTIELTVNNTVYTYTFNIGDNFCYHYPWLSDTQ